jgi:hypothetical protein
MKTERKEKIGLQDTGMDVVTKLAEGNPGAVTVMMEILQQQDEIDPDIAGMGVLGLLLFDTLGIYGSRIWMLYKDVCDSDISQVLCLLRGWQLGYLSDTEVNSAIDNDGKGIDKKEVFAKVQKRLPRFNLTKKAGSHGTNNS